MIIVILVGMQWLTKTSVVFPMAAFTIITGLLALWLLRVGSSRGSRVVIFATGMSGSYFIFTVSMIGLSVAVAWFVNFVFT